MLEDAFKAGKQTLELVPNSNHNHYALFRTLIPLLYDYTYRAYGGNIDHTIYHKQILDSPSEAFQHLDARVARSHTTWSIPAENGVVFIVRPLQQTEELTDFVNSDSRFCFFDGDRNLAMLYHYAAHSFTRVLGIWKKDESQRKADTAFGLLPLLMMGHQKQDERKKIPILYAEAPMLLPIQKLGFDTTTSEEEIATLFNGLLDLLPVYAAMQKPTSYLALGACRKRYSQPDVVSTFTEMATQRFSSWLLKNEVNTILIRDTKTGKERKATDPKYQGMIAMTLPDDKDLLLYLQSQGYPFPKLMMYTQAFIDDEQWKQNSFCSDWGIPAGRTRFIPSPTYHTYYTKIAAEVHHGINI